MVCAQILKNILVTILDSKKSENSVCAVHLVPSSTEMRKFIEEISMLCKDLVQGNCLKYKMFKYFEKLFYQTLESNVIEFLIS